MLKEGIGLCLGKAQFHSMNAGETGRNLKVTRFWNVKTNGKQVLHFGVNMKLLDLVAITVSWWLRPFRICLQCRRPEFDPQVRKIPWRREQQPTPVFLPGEPSPVFLPGESHMDTGVWQAIVHGVAKSQTGLFLRWDPGPNRSQWCEDSAGGSDRGGASGWVGADTSLPNSPSASVWVPVSLAVTPQEYDNTRKLERTCDRISESRRVNCGIRHNGIYSEVVSNMSQWHLFWSRVNITDGSRSRPKLNINKSTVSQSPPLPPEWLIPSCPKVFSKEHLCQARCWCCLVLKSCLTLCDPMDCSPPGSFVRGILQARTLEWVAISCSKGSSQPRDQTRVSCLSCICSWILYHWATREAWITACI